ncbi:nuclease-related domain-containing protein [Mycoplasmopsis felifaucium]|uniref:nuclease-related domain-containing protein n=1 Tax=Mycoplasmopsis felifaucium TaxID=35768 RepID=UPI00048238DA|nr:nuclease-related domain-containing protein [Mycoplasmopsis felifaucium]
MWKLWLSFSLITVAIILVLVFIFIANQKTRKKTTIGARFEVLVDEKLTIYAKNNGFKYLKGGLFKYSQDQYFEIDGVLIGNKSVYIVEDKYYIGKLFGISYADKLTLKIGNKEKSINNPLLQNFKHIKHFYNMCGFNFPVFSLLILPSETSYNIDQLDSWSIIANEDKINSVLDTVSNDLADEPDLSYEVIKAVIDAVNLGRATSLKDISKFNKIIHEDKNTN